jgi:hypothetical protein
MCQRFDSPSLGTLSQAVTSYQPSHEGQSLKLIARKRKQTIGAEMPMTVFCEVASFRLKAALSIRVVEIAIDPVVLDITIPSMASFLRIRRSDERGFISLFSLIPASSIYGFKGRKEVNPNASATSLET